jgi:hypothetical protein
MPRACTSSLTGKSDSCMDSWHLPSRSDESSPALEQLGDGDAGILDLESLAAMSCKYKKTSLLDVRLDFNPSFNHSITFIS